MTSTITLDVATPEAMFELGARVAAMLRAGDVVALNGELGAGKTTFTRGLGEALGVRGPVTSPTFVLARTHPNLGDGPPLVHVDAYRLSHPAELDDLDLDFAASVTVVEWAAGMLDALVDEWLEITIERPVGAGSSVNEADAAGADDSGTNSDTSDTNDDGDTNDDTDTDTDTDDDGDDDDGVALRRVTVTGRGRRWAGVTLV